MRIELLKPTVLPEVTPEEEEITVPDIEEDLNNPEDHRTCAQCGGAMSRNEEDCFKCPLCGYSEC